MRFLCAKEAIQWRTEDDAQELLEEECYFLSQHLAKWVPCFCENVRSFSSSLFYIGWADVTEGWIQYDLELVTAIVALQREDAKHQRASN
jgi:TorA maturation chaperone TorD